MSTSHIRRLAALAASGLALALVACGSTDASNDPSAPSGGAGLVSIAGTVPEGPFYPADITESNREVIARNIFDGLVRVDTDGSVVFEVAEKIETDDAVHFTVTIKSGQRFANGEAVTSASFVEAWNWGAYGPNAQKSASNYALIKGYEAVHPAQEGAEPTAQTLSGLAVVDDRTFTIELTAPTISFIGQLTDGVFVPLPQAFFDDPAGFADRPIGNGPYQLRDKIDISDGAYLDLNPNYTGTRQPRNDGLYIRFYTSLDTVYQDVLSDNLDVGSASGGGLLTAAADFGDRFIAGPGGPTQTLAFPLWDDFWGSPAGLKVRQAISHAIDRQAIIDTIFVGLAAPARDFTQRGLDGWSDAIPGVEVLDFDPDLARRLLAEAGGYPRETFTIYYNADGSHKEWVEAVANQVRENLGINAVPGPVTTFAELLGQIRDHTLDGPWRASNIPFNPGLDDMLATGYSAAAGSTTQAGYHSQDFEDLLALGRSQTSLDAANQYFNQAQSVLFRDLPVIPLWYTYQTTIHARTVQGVVLGPIAGTPYYAITKI
ncbi:MAG: ABC transporter substrate-binding protein [Propionibacteriaceae bacterium]|jgi:oligopeptide transport system substrate-binding protein|nr:ABC transporter substrate-binding protein [Propionibacteriaceae bacterium]